MLKIKTIVDNSFCSSIYSQVGQFGQVPDDFLSELPDSHGVESMEIRKYGRNWAVYDGDDLVCVTVYKKGAIEVVRRFESFKQDGKGGTPNEHCTMDKSAHTHP